MDSSGLWGFSGENEDNPKIRPEFIAPCYYINNCRIEIDTKLSIVGDQKFNGTRKDTFNCLQCSKLLQFTMLGPYGGPFPSLFVYDGDMIVLQGQEKVFLSVNGRFY